MAKGVGRNRGGQPGNSNRLKHGRYSNAAIAARRQSYLEWHEAMLLSAWGQLVLRMHAAERAGVDITAFQRRLLYGSDRAGPVPFEKRGSNGQAHA